MKSKQLREQRAKLVADARALVSGEAPTAEQKAKFDEMMGQVDAMKADIDRLERLEREEAESLEDMRAAADRKGTDPEQEKERREFQEQTFAAYLRHGPSGMDDKQRAEFQRRFKAAQSGGVASEGGYTVPSVFMQRMERALLDFGGMFSAGCEIITTDSGNEILMPMNDDTSNEGALIGENPASASEQDASFAAVTFRAYTYTSKLVKVSNQLLQDSAVDVGSMLAGMLGERIARGVHRHLTVGDGAAKPAGVVTGATSGVSGASAAAVTFDELIDLKHSVDPAYRNGARFMFNDTTLREITQLKDGQGQYLWRPGVPLVGAPDTIMNDPYTINQHMATMASSAKSILYGNFRKYMIRRVSGALVMRLSERYAELNQTAFVAFQRWDGGIVDAGTHPIKYFQNAA